MRPFAVVAAIVWTVYWTPYIQTYIEEQGRPPERPVTIGVFRVLPDTTILIGEIDDPPDTLSLQAIPHGERHYFTLRARWTTGSSWSPFSLLVSGASVMLTAGPEPYTESTSTHPGSAGRDYLKVRLPAGVPFLSSWSWRPPLEVLPGYSEVFWASCLWDLNHDSVINLSDFSLFGLTNPTAEQVKSFARIYNKPSFHLVVITRGGRP
jgi:hypothetical protein